MGIDREAFNGRERDEDDEGRRRNAVDAIDGVRSQLRSPRFFCRGWGLSFFLYFIYLFI